MSKAVDKILNKISEEIIEPPATIFDSFDTSLDTRISGNALKERLAELTQTHSRIRQLCTHAMLMFKQSTNRREDVIALAWEAVDKSLKVTAQRILVKSTEVEIEGEKTTINNEEQRINLYEYVHQRGKDKIDEIGKTMDAARSMLSWDKQEYNKSFGEGK